MNAAMPWLDARRAEALESFRLKGVPHRRIEEWKYSDVRSVIGAEEIAAADTAKWQIEGETADVDVVDLSGEIPQWARDRFAMLGLHNAMESASLAFAKGGIAMRVTGNKAAGPLRLNWSGHGHARVFIVLEEGASLTLVEKHAKARGLRNIGTEILLANNAQLSHIAVAEKSDEAVGVETITVKVGPDARYNAHFANFGARLSRFDITVTLEGEGSEARLSGVSALGGGTHADVTTHIIHAVSHTQSVQLFKKVAAGKSRAIYQGQITVREGANGSDSRQTAKGILLGERAEIDLKPELEIYADDVKCAHGAAVGDLEAEQLFYLRARGVPEAEARNLLIRAFLEEAVLEIPEEAIRAEVWREVEAALEHLV
ncbi:MAG TPA: Fe-S cluster assembly protein SufD [Rhizomicrobium sp.]|nr:Fe-S cluster assembly protein SufD [Rhizomicrobium sp.]